MSSRERRPPTLPRSLASSGHRSAAGRRFGRLRGRLGREAQQSLVVIVGMIKLPETMSNRSAPAGSTPLTPRPQGGDFAAASRAPRERHTPWRCVSARGVRVEAVDAVNAGRAGARQAVRRQRVAVFRAVTPRHRLRFSTRTLSGKYVRSITWKRRSISCRISAGELRCSRRMNQR